MFKPFIQSVQTEEHFDLVTIGEVQTACVPSLTAATIGAQTALVAAAQAAGSNSLVRQIDVRRLQRIPTEQGAEIGQTVEHADGRQSR